MSIKTHIVILDSNYREKCKCTCVVDTNTFTIHEEGKQTTLRKIPLSQILNAFPITHNGDALVHVGLAGGEELQFKCANILDSQKLSISLLAEPSSHEALTMTDFDIIAELGCGLTSKVMKVICKKNHKVYAIKSIKKDALLVGVDGVRAFQERNILMRVKHPFIVPLYCSFQSETRFHLVLEYVQGGDLRTYIDREFSFSLEQVRFYIAECTLALQYLHSMGLIYHDMKPENILLTASGNIKLTDFGLSTEIGKESTLSGTLEYAAPELIQSKKYDQGIDWWALGAVAYELIVGKRPFLATSEISLESAIVNNPLKIPEDVDETTASFLSQLLQKEPKNRLGDDNIMSHPFFASIDWTKLAAQDYKMEFRPLDDESQKAIKYCNDLSDSFTETLEGLLDVPGFSWSSDSFRCLVTN